MPNTTDPRAEIARKNIRIAAAMRNMNLSEVSRQAGMSRNGVGQFVAGTTSLSYANMLKVCDVLQLPIGLVHRPIVCQRAVSAFGAHLSECPTT